MSPPSNMFSGLSSSRNASPFVDSRENSFWKCSEREVNVFMKSSFFLTSISFIIRRTSSRSFPSLSFLTMISLYSFSTLSYISRALMLTAPISVLIFSNSHISFFMVSSSLPSNRGTPSNSLLSSMIPASSAETRAWSSETLVLFISSPRRCSSFVNVSLSSFVISSETVSLFLKRALNFA